MVLNTDAIKRDYERLNALGLLLQSRARHQARPGRQEAAARNAGVARHRAAHRSASVGFGYSGGITGQGLYGTLGFSDTNLHGTGNSGSVQFEKGARTERRSDYRLGSVPRQLRRSRRSTRVGGQLFANRSTYYYPVYGVTSSSPGIPSVGGNAGADSGHALPGHERRAESAAIVATNTSSSIGASGNDRTPA